MKKSADQNTQYEKKNYWVKYLEGKDLFVIEQREGPALFINANLVRHLLGYDLIKKVEETTRPTKARQAPMRARKAVTPVRKVRKAK